MAFSLTRWFKIFIKNREKLLRIDTYNAELAENFSFSRIVTRGDPTCLILFMAMMIMMTIMNLL